jgi:rod shape determining protein RodA
MKSSRFDLLITVPTTVVFTAGLVHLHALDPSHRLVIHQCVYALIGLMASAVCYHLAREDKHRVLSWIHGLAVALVVLCLMGFHAPMRGVRRWLRVGPLVIQASELLKFALVAAIARWFGDAPLVTRTRLRDALGIAILVVVPVAMVAAQPDLGTAVLLVAVAATTLVVTPHARRSLAFLAAMTLLPAALMPKLLLHEYQIQRLHSFLRPSTHDGSQWQSDQAHTAYELGRWHGPFHPTRDLAHIPDAHTDFVLASWANRYGFLGVLVILGALFLVTQRAFETARLSRERFDIALATGIGAMLLWQVTINAAMTLGVLPVVGIPMPLMSFGGSNMVTTLAALGALMGVRARVVNAPAEPEIPGAERLYRGVADA